MLVIIYVLGWHDMIANGMLSKHPLDNIRRSFKDYLGAIYYFKYIVLIGTAMIALALYGLRSLVKSARKSLLWVVFFGYCLAVIPHLIVWPLWIYGTDPLDHLPHWEFLYTAFFLPICLIILATGYHKKYGHSVVELLIIYLVFLTCIWLSCSIGFFVWVHAMGTGFINDSETYGVLTFMRFLGCMVITIGFLFVYFSSRKRRIDKPNV